MKELIHVGTLELKRHEEFKDLPSPDTVYGSRFHEIFSRSGVTEEGRKRILHGGYPGVFNGEEVVTEFAQNAIDIMPPYNEFMRNPLQAMVRRFKGKHHLEGLVLRGSANSEEMLKNLQIYGIDGISDEYAQNGIDNDQLQKDRRAIFGVDLGRNDVYYGNPFGTTSSFALTDLIRKATRGMRDDTSVEDFSERILKFKPTLTVYHAEGFTNTMNGNAYVLRENKTYSGALLAVIVADLKFVG